MMLHERPMASVCLASYNNGAFLRPAIDSILAQTYEHLEIIIGDNASTDETAAILKTYDDPRIRCVRQDQTIGCLNHWNVLLQEAKGDYIALYHADDVYHQEIVEKEIHVLCTHHNAGAVFCLDRLIDEQGNYVRDGIVLPQRLRIKKILDFEDVLSEMVRRSSSFLVAPTFMARRTVFDKIGWFDENEDFGESIGGAGDVEMWMRIAQKFGIGLVQERLIDRRISRFQGSTQYEGARGERANHFTVIDHFLRGNENILSENVLKQYQFNQKWDDALIAVNLLAQGKQPEAAQIIGNLCLKNELAVIFDDIKNIFKLILILLFKITFFLNVPQIGMKVIQGAKRQYNKF